MKLSVLIISLFFGFSLNAQYNWQITILDTLPEPTANNAVCEGFVNGERFVYSFGGIDTTKTYSGIHRKSYRYNVSTNHWEVLPAIPDTLGKIASAASYIDGKIYLIGGYHVLANGSEISSNKLHIFNTSTNSWEADGQNIPFPIDDHVQCKYKDSLIYVVSGWSNTGNSNKVQIYDVYNNTWSQGTEVPNNSFYKHFGASGYIVEDTIYYAGGVSGQTSFTARTYMRKGVIDPEQPNTIQWSLLDDLPSEPLYRSACTGYQNTIFWIGGASVAYNYDGIAYNGTGGVEPNQRILHFNSETNKVLDNLNFPLNLMDLRGVAKIGGGNWIVAGGMDTSQVVSNATYLLHNPNYSGILNGKLPPFFNVYQSDNEFIVDTEFAGSVDVYNINGKLLYSGYKLLADLVISKDKLKDDLLIFIFDDGSNVPVFQKVIMVK